MRLFESGFTALWTRTEQTLGEVTLMAIVDRVFHISAEQYPLLCDLRMEGRKLHFDTLRARAATIERMQLVNSILFVMVEFLAVLGKLTADILTPALQAELMKQTPGQGGAELAKDAKS
ncbi:MAG: hypothetical protein ABI821_03665 [Pseudomonadota bacterium]